MKNNTEAIDFVIPWLDEADEEWARIQKSHLPTKQSDITDSQAPARFRDMGTLKYVLRSIEQNCPWYNKIYLITKGTSPSWLNINHPKIVLINEADLFFNKDHLPVFSSNAVEMNLPNIQRLSNKFIYLNDDMLIMNKLNSTRFFMNNKPVDFLSHRLIPRNKLVGIFKKHDTWIASLNNALQLINQKFYPIKLNKELLFHKSYTFFDKSNNLLLDRIYKKFLWIQHWHHPQPYLKSTLIEVYKEFGKEMMKCSSTKFRSHTDLNQYLYRYWQLAKGSFYPHKHNDAQISNLGSSKALKKFIRKIESHKNTNFTCFNDSVHLTDKEYQITKNMLLDYLELKFPKKSCFERSSQQ